VFEALFHAFMKRTDSGRSPEKALLIVISLLLIFIGVVLTLRPLPISDKLELSPAKTSGTGTITSDGFTTVFMLADNALLAFKTYQENLIFRVVLLLAIGIIGLLYAGALLIYSLIFKLKPKRAISIVGGAGIIMFVGIGGLNILNATDARQVGNCAHLQTLYDARQYQITEGTVHVLSVQAEGGHGKVDNVNVGNVSFEVDYFLATCAYKQSITHGGTLTEGTYARIYYSDYRTILRIDVKNQ
jgi:hypothetical protein